MHRNFLMWAMLIKNQRIDQLHDDKRQILRDEQFKKGMDALDGISQRKPRHALRSVQAKQIHEDKVDRSMIKLLMIFARGLAGRFALWKMMAGLAT
jgi:hypothetical protein